MAHTTNDELGDTASHGGYLRCETCHATGRVDPRYWWVGWPKCCGYTMRWWTQRQLSAGEHHHNKGEHRG